MRLALNMPHQFLRILISLMVVTLFAIALAQCPSLGNDNRQEKSFHLAVPFESDDLPNLREPRPNVHTAGQPTVRGMQEMARRGIRTVINLRPQTEAGARDESTEVRKLGMNYHYIPVTPNTFSLEKVDEFACILKDEKNSPFFIHCHSGNRVGGMWFLYRVLVEKADISVALTEGRQIGMTPALEGLLLDFIQRTKEEKPEFLCQSQR